MLFSTECSSAKETDTISCLTFINIWIYSDLAIKMLRMISTLLSPNWKTLFFFLALALQRTENANFIAVTDEGSSEKHTFRKISLRNLLLCFLLHFKSVPYLTVKELLPLD